MVQKEDRLVQTAVLEVRPEARKEAQMELRSEGKAVQLVQRAGLAAHVGELAVQLVQRAELAAHLGELVVQLVQRVVLAVHLGELVVQSARLEAQEVKAEC